MEIICELRGRITGAAWGGIPAPTFTADEKSRMEIMLQKRCNRDSVNRLNLSSLASDSDLGTLYTRNKANFFAELMQTYQNLREQAQLPTYTEELPIIIDLSNNNFADLDVIATLPQTFPDLSHLSLANNKFLNIEALSPWSRELHALKDLDLRGNPFTTTISTWGDQILQWYPRLMYLNGLEVRTEAEARIAQEKIVPISSLIPVSQDHSKAEVVIQAFFPAYDHDRSSLAGKYYEAESTFSVTINQHGRRAPGHPVATWETYTKKQNMIKYSFVPVARLEANKGPQRIRECWNALPYTRHPDVNLELYKYKYEEKEYTPAGVPQALVVVVRGEFEELTHPTGNVTALRSFDRTFIIEETQGLFGYRIVSDILVISPYSSNVRDSPQDKRPISYEQTMAGPYMARAKSHAVDLHLPPSFGAHVAGKTQEQVSREKLAEKLSRSTRFKIEKSGVLLERSGWDYDQAIKIFEREKVATNLH